MKFAIFAFSLSILSVSCGERPDRIVIAPKVVTVDPSRSTDPIVEFPSVDPTQSKPSVEHVQSNSSDSGENRSVEVTDKSDTKENVNLPNQSKKDGDPVTPIDDSKDHAVSVSKWGVNFEDMPGTDEDYNDSVFCFSGSFDVTSTNITSLSLQEVKATTSSISFCKHSLQVSVFKSDDTLSWSKLFLASSENEISFQIGKGEKIEVNMFAVDGCDAGVSRSMRDGRFAKILKNQCNKTGQ